MKNIKKYAPGYFLPPESCMDWTKKEKIEKSPIWCSVDLRDGNQALVVPMTLEEKLSFFQYLILLGFKEIEVGFPAASQVEYQLMRRLIDDNLVPDDVYLQVLTQSREHIIEKTFESLKGVKNAIVHLYNSTSFNQRQQVFKTDKDNIKKIATDGAKILKDYRDKFQKEYGSNIIFEYSPESFTGTEPEFALEVCNAVIDIWQPSAENPVIINLPSTVQLSLPHIYASQIEYMSKNLKCREHIRLSLHPHNDRGTGIAEGELGLLAGADRIEGTLFGNGERTGNLDIVTMALNMYTHGIDPKLDFSNIPEAIAKYEKFTGMTVPERHPYSGNLVFAAFSGSHQDAISKGMTYHRENKLNTWSVPYLPLDPSDIGKAYEADVIRINSQSGKGGVSFVLRENYGIDMPKDMGEELSYYLKNLSSKRDMELKPSDIYTVFKEKYVNRIDYFNIKDFHFTRLNSTNTNNSIKVNMTFTYKGEEKKLEALGNGRLDAINKGLTVQGSPLNYHFLTYKEHSLEMDSGSRACSYVAIKDTRNDTVFWGVGIDSDIIQSSIGALVSAINRMIEKGEA